MDYGISGVLLNVRHCNLQHSDVVLNGTNYIPWKLIVKRILCSIRFLRHVYDTSIALITPSLSLSAITSFSLAAFALLIAFEQQLEKWNADNSTAKIIICQTVTLEIQTHITAMLVRCGSILSVATVVQVRHSSTACIKPSVISSRGGYC